MTLHNLISEIGDDADLLIKNDEWLEEERRITAAELDQKAKELHSIHLAQRIKGLMQQKNLVAIQELLRTTDGDIKDIIIRVIGLPDAFHILSHHNDSYDVANSKAQMLTWNKDGYDINVSAALRTTPGNR